MNETKVVAVAHDCSLVQRTIEVGIIEKIDITTAETGPVQDPEKTDIVQIEGSGIAAAKAIRGHNPKIVSTVIMKEIVVVLAEVNQRLGQEVVEGV